VVVLNSAAAVGGLLIDGLYPDSAVAASAFRGNDLAVLLVGMPTLTLAVIGSMRGSLRAHLVWIGMLAYSIYNLAYYVFGAQFNDLFLLHVAAFISSAFAFGLASVTLDVTSVGKRFARVPVRWISVLLLLPAAAIVVLYSVSAVRFAVTGQQPSDVLPMPPGTRAPRLRARPHPARARGHGGSGSTLAAYRLGLCLRHRGVPCCRRLPAQLHHSEDLRCRSGCRGRDAVRSP
jgi:hypothetical protein